MTFALCACLRPKSMPTYRDLMAIWQSVLIVSKMYFQPIEGPSRGLLSEYEIFANLREPSLEVPTATAVRAGGDISGGRRAGWCRPANCPPGGV